MRSPVPSLEVVYRSFISASEAWTSFSLLSSSARYLGKNNQNQCSFSPGNNFIARFVLEGRALANLTAKLQRCFCCYVVRPPRRRFQPCARAEIKTQTWPFTVAMKSSTAPFKKQQRKWIWTQILKRGLEHTSLPSAPSRGAQRWHVRQPRVKLPPKIEFLCQNH